ncbi:HvfC/BufC N-terminal domain-containing protein [Anianabacter salinae]|uniref:HvfC/BufC N-terminal domain-containing protein n=1 Tax=Anianabacter salinae TaxID=2851023 RepID=UPI00225DF98D|nr:DNA-binding domain-containing protein [Anianabacter salinae]MBV0914025.1 putative DNA-binding domain-containing protein [Anianabacter salinae]
MPSHPEFAGSFAEGLRTAALPPGAVFCDGDADLRFAVYRNNVSHSLSEALGQRFPVIRRLVGDPFFAALGRVYSETHRPRTPVLLDWGDSFPDFLAGFAPLAGYPYMRDVARLEWARGRAYHAADAAPLDPAAVAGADPSRLVLTLHPSVQVLQFGAAALTIWRQNQPGADAAQRIPSGDQFALVLRDRSLAVQVHEISQGDLILVEHLATGATLHAAAELAQWADPGHAPQTVLVLLMQAGGFIHPPES